VAPSDAVVVEVSIAPAVRPSYAPENRRLTARFPVQIHAETMDRSLIQAENASERARDNCSEMFAPPYLQMTTVSRRPRRPPDGYDNRVGTHERDTEAEQAGHNVWRPLSTIE
jgi:hypothetical protein